MTAEEARRELAYAYRIADMLGLSDFVFGHISLRCDAGFLIKKPMIPFSKVTPDNLDWWHLQAEDKLFSDFGIHRHVLKKHNHLDAVLHVHSTAISTIASGDGNLEPASQHAMIVNSSLTTHEYQKPFVFEQQFEDLLYKIGYFDFVLLKNHGFVTAGRTLSAVMFNAYLFEEACKVQVQLNGSFKPVKVPEAAAEKDGALLLLRKYQRSYTLWEGLKSCITL